jgi:hypothetical protein
MDDQVHVTDKQEYTTTKTCTGGGSRLYKNEL